MKNAPKTLKKILPCVFALGITALSVLTPFLPLKKASAESFPPSSDDFFPTLPSFYGFTVSTGVNSNNDEEDYYTTTSYPLTYDNGNGTSVYQFDDMYPVYLRYTPDSSVYTRYDLRSINLTGSLNAYNRWELGDIYLDRELYEHFFGGASLSLGGATDYEFTEITYIASWKLVVYNYDTQLFQEMDFVQSGYSRTRFCEFRSLTWDDFYSAYGHLGYVCVRSFSIDFRVPVDNFSGYVSLTVNHLSTPVEADYFRNTQLEAWEEWSPYSWRTATSTGLETITGAVSDFLNMEFVPGFKLWYFLLIGLGCAVTGVALKFFLGG